MKISQEEYNRKLIAYVNELARFNEVSIRSLGVSMGIANLGQRLQGWKTRGLKKPLSKSTYDKFASVDPHMGSGEDVRTFLEGEDGLSREKLNQVLALVM